MGIKEKWRAVSIFQFLNSNPLLSEAVKAQEGFRVTLCQATCPAFGYRGGHC